MIENVKERAVVSMQRRVFAAALILSAVGLLASTTFASNTTVNITATVSTTVTCNSSTGTLPFGTLSAGSVNVTNPTNVSTTMACNDGAGCTESLNDLGNTSTPGLWNASSTYLIQSPKSGSTSTTSTISAGVEGYGIVATTTAAGGGGTLSMNQRYNFTTGSGIIGSLTTSSLTLASSTSAITTAREVLSYPEAAISGTTLGGSYLDTLTYSCTGN